MLLATAYRLRIETPDDPPGPWSWCWAECDERGDSQGDGEGPFDTQVTAAAEARRHNFIVVQRQRRR